MEREYYMIKTKILDMKVNLLMANQKEKGNIYLKMDHIVQYNLKMVYQMEK